RSACAAAHHIRAGRQSQDREGARPYRPAIDPRPRHRGHRMSDRSLLALNLAEARDGLVRRRFSARELAAAYNDAVEETKPINAYITPTPERALAMADAAD